MVCQGNICRSPMAEGFFAHQLTENHSPINVRSAGLTAVINYPAESNALAVMKSHGIDISRHRARQLTEALVRQANFIFVMTKSQKINLERKFLIAKGKTFLLGHWQAFEIPDPVNQSIEIFESVYKQIELAWQDWKKNVSIL